MNAKMKWTGMTVCVVAALVLPCVGLAANGAPTVQVTKMANPSDIWLADSCGTPQITTITLTVTGYGGTMEETLPIDIVFGIDSSGSMAWNDPGKLRLAAAKSFTDKLDATRDQAGVVSWNHAIDFTFGLSSDLNQVKNKIDQVPSSGGTNLEVGLAACVAMLDANPRDPAEQSVKAVIFLTDGIGTYTGAATAAAAAKGYVIYSIGLSGGQPQNQVPLTDMAIKTGGLYFSSPDADNLQAIFDSIFTTIILRTAPQNVDVVEVTQPYIIDEDSFSIVPDFIMEVDGKTKMVWLNVATYVGNEDDWLAADETFEVSFTARSSQAGYMLPVDVPGMAVVTYTDPDGDPQIVPIPQAYITVGFCVAFDIRPQSCPNPLNIRGGGVLPAAIVGTDDLAVESINPETIVLTREGIAGGVPVQGWAYEDVESPFTGTPCGCHATGPDGIMDLSLKFDSAQVVETLKLDELDRWTTEPLILLGNLHDGTPFRGIDCVRIQ